MRIVIFLAFVLSLVNCARAPIKEVAQAMRPISSPPIFSDSLAFKGLPEALEKNIARLREFEALGSMTLSFGPKTVALNDYIRALEDLLRVIVTQEREDVEKYIATRFELFEVYGDKEWGDVFVTGYYEPMLKGSKRKSKEFTQALYGLPKDMVLIQMGKFGERFPHWSVFQDKVTEQRSSTGVLRGRLVASTDKNQELATIEPYFDRREIDELGLIKGKADVLAYVDPVDAFFLQIQGSGWVDFGKSKVHLGYKAQNGYPYFAIGKNLLEIIPKEQMTQQKIERHLRSLSPEARQQMMNTNPSYVFFTKLDKGAVTFMGTEVTAGRTIATDKTYFAKGALAFLDIEEPTFDRPDSDEPTEWRKSGRWVLDQDTGGAIRGPGRVDLFLGLGPEAGQTAGVMKRRGRLYYAVPRPVNEAILSLK